MRKGFLPTLLLLLIAQISSAQLWIELGPKVSFGPSGYYNATLVNDSQHDYSLNLAYSYGAALGLNIGDRHGLNFELMRATFFQDITYRPNTQESFRNNLEWEIFDYYCLYRFYPQSGIFIEGGAKYTDITELTQTSGIESVIVKEQYEESYISGVLGIGAFLSGSETMVFKTNLRFEYGLTDFVTPEGRLNGYPSIDSNITDQGNTVPYRISFGLELSFGVGGFAKGACGRRGFMLGTQYY
jgi:hypothetical protein